MAIILMDEQTRFVTSLSAVAQWLGGLSDRCTKGYSFVSYVDSLGGFSNDDGDGNDNAAKQ